MARIVTILLLITACSSSEPSDGACQDNADCRAGLVCLDGVCIGICASSDDCDTGTCCTDSVCLPCDVEPPVISAVNGTGSIDGDSTHTDRHLRGELVISGDNLANASVALTGEGRSWELASCAPATDTELRVALPNDLVAGNFLLTLANQGGSCSADLRLLQGEPGSLDASGAEIVASINTAMTADSGLSVTRAGDLACSGCVGNDHLALTAPFVVGALTVESARVGVGTPEPSGLFEVSAGYTYVWQETVTGTPTPACPCDQDAGSFDCGGTSSEFTVDTYHGADCYDTGTGGVQHYTTTDAPSIVVADDGAVSINGLGVEIVTEQLYLANWSSDSVTVNCPTGKRVIGGGCHGSRVNSDNCSISRNYPSSATSWHCHAQSTTTSDLTLTAYAICANVN